MSCWARPEKRVARRAGSAKDRILGVFLSFARLIGCVHMGSDLQRFIVATSFLMHAFTNYSVD
ncbi:hypothetical protein FP026_00880 [Rhizobium tropici]|uniref:Uncharacterized protein n=1 Tax=Rhizobium tropici TaxID=398 RepID=A0A5B0WH15_RHITR|nr:hypothetical protein FP026_00880 [Rhizobium tropici]